MSEEKHALLSASGSHKWLVCPPSARLEENFENKSSDYMAEGTLAHAIAEFKVKNYFFDKLSKRSYNAKIKKFEKEEFYQEEMLEHTDTYLDYIKELALQGNVVPYAAVEQTIRYDMYAPEGFGTADFIMVSGDTLAIVDFKYGKGVKVLAEDNPQLKLYALGALEIYKIIYPISKIKLAIVQPRMDNISEFELTREELEKWGNEVVRPQAEKAFRGEGDFTPGEHCRFCRAKGSCRTRTEKNLKAYSDAKNTPIITPLELGRVLLEIDGLDAWYKDLKEEALKLLLAGKNVEGWKAVEGKSNRQITDIEALFKVIVDSGIDEAMLYERKPLGLTALEKLVTKKKFEELAKGYINKPKGAPTLAKDSDKREKYKESSAQEDFRKRGKIDGF